MERPQARPPIPNPAPVRTRPVEWRVLTPDRLPEGDDWVYFGVDPQNYENLARNQADQLRYIREADWRLKYYRGDLMGSED